MEKTYNSHILDKNYTEKEVYRTFGINKKDLYSLIDDIKKSVETVWEDKSLNNIKLEIQNNVKQYENFNLLSSNKEVIINYIHASFNDNNKIIEILSDDQKTEIAYLLSIWTENDKSLMSFLYNRDYISKIIESKEKMYNFINFYQNIWKNILWNYDWDSFAPLINLSINELNILNNPEKISNLTKLYKKSGKLVFNKLVEKSWILRTVLSSEDELKSFISLIKELWSNGIIKYLEDSCDILK